MNCYCLYLPLCREDPGVSYGLNLALAGRGVIVTDKAFQNLMPSDLQQKGATVAGSCFVKFISASISMSCFVVLLSCFHFCYRVELSSGLPVLVRGNIIGGSSEISKAQFSKLLKQACIVSLSLSLQTWESNKIWAIFICQSQSMTTMFDQILMCASRFQVTTHISSISDIFVHDGAIGLSPKCDAKVRIISDGPSSVLSLSSTLWRTSTRAVSHDSCPLTIYVATSIR